MTARVLKPLRSRGITGSSGPLQARRMKSMSAWRIGARAHGPDHVVEIVGIDIVIDDDDVAAEIGAGAALGGDEAGLLGVAGIALLDRYGGEKSALKAGDAADIRHAGLFHVIPDERRAHQGCHPSRPGDATTARR